MKTLSTATTITSHDADSEVTVTKKLDKNRGFTMVELLCALAVLILLTSCVIVGVNMSTKSFSSITKATNARELSDVLNSLIADELRYATQIKTDENGALTYRSITQGTGAQLVVKDGMVCVKVQNKDPNTDTIKDEYWNLVSPDMYSNGCKVGALNTTYTPATKIFDVSITIVDAAGNSILTDGFHIEAIKPQ